MKDMWTTPKKLLGERTVRLLLLLWAAAVLYFSIIPPPEPPRGFWGIDKIEHIVAYGVLSLLFKRAGWNWSSNFITITIVTTFGIFVECLQYFHPPREASVGDALANGIGVFLGVILANKLKS